MPSGAPDATKTRVRAGIASWAGIDLEAAAAMVATEAVFKKSRRERSLMAEIIFADGANTAPAQSLGDAQQGRVPLAPAIVSVEFEDHVDGGFDFDGLAVEQIRAVTPLPD